MTAARAPWRAVPGALASARRRRFPLWGWIGALVFAAGAWALVRDVPAVNAIWYLPAWYGYLLFIDAALFRASGRSLVSSGGRALAFSTFWSIPFWFSFEAYNLRLHNWWYVFVLRQPWAEALVSFIAFATVLPACLLHADLLEAFGRAKKRGVSRPRLRVLSDRVFWLLGAACAIAPLLAPRQAFGMVWFIPFFLAEPVLARSAAPSLLREIREGEYGRLARLAAGGLWAGLVWELFNFWARSKWLYTVPGFELPKLFEMPLAGYFGFPALAISAFSFISLARLSLARRPLRAGVAVLGALLFCGIVLRFVLDRTVLSRRPVLSEISSLDAGAIVKLEEAGVSTPERLERRAERMGLAALAESVGLDRKLLETARAEAALALHKGMGVPFAKLLERAGVRDVAALSREDPARLLERLRAAAAPGDRVPPDPIVRLWIRSAPPDGTPRR